MADIIPALKINDFFGVDLLSIEVQIYHKKKPDANHLKQLTYLHFFIGVSYKNVWLKFHQLPPTIQMSTQALAESDKNNHNPLCYSLIFLKQFIFYKKALYLPTKIFKYFNIASTINRPIFYFFSKKTGILRFFYNFLKLPVYRDKH